MSLRKRLTLWSAIVLALVVAVLGTLAVLSVRYFLLQRVDINLDQQTTATLNYIYLRQQQNLQSILPDKPVDAVFYTVIDKSGDPVHVDRPMPINADFVVQALQGETVTGTVNQLDGSAVRVMLKPLRYGRTGEIVGVLQASTPLGYIDQVLGELSI